MLGNDFWVVRGPESTRGLAEWARGENKLGQIVCPIDPHHRRGGKRLTDLSVTLARGVVKDFVWTWQNDCLIQDRVLNIFRQNDLTGFEIKPVKARFKQSDDAVEPPPILWELVPTGWAGLASADSGIKIVQFCPGCKHAHYSGLASPEKLIDSAQWDGSDFFIVWPMPKYLFVTARVVEVIRTNKLKGVRINAENELEPTEGFSPGRLSYWMPESVASERAKASGIAEV